MFDTINQLRSHLPRWGWVITEEGDTLATPQRAYGTTLSLASSAPPLGRRVQLGAYEGYFDWSGEGDVIVRPVEPKWFDDVRLPEEQARRDGFRQLRRILRWFHDPRPEELWAERRSPEDWMPLDTWLAMAPASTPGLEARWPFCTDPDEMLRYLGAAPSERKLRLFACALTRCAQPMSDNDRQLLAFAEEHAEGRCPRRELKKALKGTPLHWLLSGSPAEVVATALDGARRFHPATGNALATDLLREIIGDPFHPIPIRHLWLRLHRGTVRDLAEGIATRGDFDLMPMLADALEDAGCTDARLLSHARNGGPHVRGCWLLDLLLDRK